MKYIGMPMGMWALFAGSFQKQLTEVLGYDTDTAKAITKNAKPKYKAIIADLPEFEKADRFKMNIVNCAMIGAFVLSMPERPDRDTRNLPDAAQQGTGHLRPRRHENEPGQPHDHPAGKRRGAAAGAKESLHQSVDFPAADQPGAADESGDSIPAAQNAVGGSGTAEHSLS